MESTIPRRWQSRSNRSSNNNVAYEIIRRKGGTNYAIASALTRIIEVMLRDEAAVFIVSVLVDGHYGIHDVCLSLPAIIDKPGISQVLPIQLSNDEVKHLQSSAQAIHAAVKSAGGLQVGCQVQPVAFRNNEAIRYSLEVQPIDETTTGNLRRIVAYKIH